MRVVQPVERAILVFAGESLAGVLDEVLDDAVGLQLLCAILQVLPHEVLGEGEDAEMSLLQHLPLRNFTHCEAEGLKHLADVDALLIG